MKLVAMVKIISSVQLVAMMETLLMEMGKKINLGCLHYTNYNIGAHLIAM